MTCAADQYCISGECACRPGLTDVGGSCVDLQTDPDNCGAAANACTGATPDCADGTCVSGCPGGTESCGGACVDLSSNPLHCDSCDSGCGTDEICANGDCREFRPGVGCSTCPCETACRGDFSQCCVYPGRSTDVVCVDGDCT
jgi:hypothetical protein